MYGIQTGGMNNQAGIAFENDVKMYGIQTFSSNALKSIAFENDVKMYGIQTKRQIKAAKACLRMM